jgi:hypothetical protein
MLYARNTACQEAYANQQAAMVHCGCKKDSSTRCCNVEEKESIVLLPVTRKIATAETSPRWPPEPRKGWQDEADARRAVLKKLLVVLEYFRSQRRDAAESKDN